MMNDVLNYVRSFFSAALLPTRKRSRLEQDHGDRPTKKYRRSSNSQNSMNEDDWISTSSSGSVRRQSNLCSNGNKPSDNHKMLEQKPKYHPVITIDDDDDLRRNKVVYRATPSANRGKFLIPVQQRYEPKKKSPAKSSLPLSYYNSNGNSFKLTTNGCASDESTPICHLSRDERTFRPTPRKSYSSALDQSIRLDEKRKYREMLSKSVRSPIDAFSEYGTPIGRIANPNRCDGSAKSRGRLCVDLAQSPTGAKPKPIAFVDLTRPRLSTKDTIAKVLNSFAIDDVEARDVVEVKDADSDVEILPDPPTPEPDVKVERINTLKTYIDLSETTKDNWICNIVARHRVEMSKQKQKIEEQEALKRKLRELNAEIRMKKLEEDVRKVLLIKDFLLPAERPADELPPLTGEQERKLGACFDRRAPENEILASKFNMNITRRDLMTLHALNWLNDEVINFYMNLIVERAKCDAGRRWPRTHAMNTFFYHKIAKDGYASVRRWTKKVDVFAHDLLVVPIHLSMHWCVAIVDFRAKRIDYYDSMGSSNDKCLKILYNYLQQEHADKKRREYDMSGWETRNVKAIPQQMNGSDCGMFACTFAEFLTRDAPVTFTQADMPYLRRKMAVEIVEGRLLIC